MTEWFDLPTVFILNMRFLSQAGLPDKIGQAGCRVVRPG
jgi:hypothetical protein